MVKLVEKEEVNAQINYIFKLHGKGKSDKEIADFFTENNEMNLKRNTFDWNEKDITIIRENFKARYEQAKSQKRLKITRPRIAIKSEEIDANNDNHEVVITDIKIPFWQLVMLMVQFALASIPALIIIAILWSFAVLVVGGVQR